MNHPHAVESANRLSELVLGEKSQSWPEPHLAWHRAEEKLQKAKEEAHVHLHLHLDGPLAIRLTSDPEMQKLAAEAHEAKVSLAKAIRGAPPV
jgi:hypothetical protein